MLKGGKREKMNNSKYIVPDRFKAAKKRISKTTNEQFAEYVGVCLKHFQNYVNAKRPVPPDMLIKICERLNTSPEWLTGESDRDFGFSTEEEKALAALLPGYALELALSEYLVTDRRQSLHPENEYISVKGEKLSRKEFDYLTSELVKTVDYAAERIVDTILTFRKNQDSGQ